MGNQARGKRSLSISDRSGAAFPYTEMVKEWQGSWVHISEYEPKHPQLDPPYHSADAQALPWARPARQEPMTVYVGSPGDSAFTSNGMQPSTETRDLNPILSVGTVSIVIS